METLGYLFGSIWSDNPFLGKLIVLSLIVLTAHATRTARRHRRRYQRELSDLATAENAIHRWRQSLAITPNREAEPNEEVESASEPPLPNEPEEKPSEGRNLQFYHPPLINISEISSELHQESLIADRLSLIERLRTLRVKVNISTLQELTLRRDAAYPGLTLPSHAVNLSMMLGLLGTFLGLSVVVQQVFLSLPAPTGTAEVMSLTTWADSAQNIRNVLGGMKTAFSTSLVGIISATICTSYAHRLRTQRAEVFAYLERLTVQELLPATVPLVEEDQLLERVTFQLEESFLRLDEIFLNNQIVLKEMTAAQETFVRMLDEVRSITKGQSAQNLDRIISSLAESTKSMMSFAEHLPPLVKAVQQSGVSMKNQMASLREQINQPIWERVSGRAAVIGLLLFAAAISFIEVARRLL